MAELVLLAVRVVLVAKVVADRTASTCIPVLMVPLVLLHRFLLMAEVAHEERLEMRVIRVSTPRPVEEQVVSEEILHLVVQQVLAEPVA